MSHFARHAGWITQLAAVGIVIMIGFRISPGFGATLSQGLDIDLASTAILSMIARLAAVMRRLPPGALARGLLPSGLYARSSESGGTAVPGCLLFVKTSRAPQAFFPRQTRERPASLQPGLSIVSI